MNMVIVEVNKRTLVLGEYRFEISHELTKWLIKYRNIDVKYNMKGE